MESLNLIYKNSVIAYKRFGTGPKQLVCFHGYGEEAGVFGFLGKYTGNQYTFYAIDLPFHGITEWKEESLFTIDDLKKIIETITKDEDSELRTPGSELSLLGFSLGGRIALSLYQRMPDQIEKLVLLAPDGLKVNFWYWLSTQTWPGRKFFAFTMKHPWWFFGFLKLLNKLKLVNASIFKFVNYYIGDAEARQLLYKRWTCLRKLKPNLYRIKNYIRLSNTSVRLVYGQHDRIILPVVGERFKKGIEENCILTVIHSGHQVLHEKHADEIILAIKL
jgi:pimeloyl-ACP methyl ester carboxylesterase